MPKPNAPYRWHQPKPPTANLRRGALVAYLARTGARYPVDSEGARLASMMLAQLDRGAVPGRGPIVPRARVLDWLRTFEPMPGPAGLALAAIIYDVAEGCVDAYPDLPGVQA